MRRKQLWKKISYIAVSGVLAVSVPAAVMQVPVSAGEQAVQETEKQQREEKTGAAQTSASQTNASPTETPQTDPPQTNTPQTEPPQTDPPQTNPPEPPQTNPPEPPQTNPPEPETPSTEVPSEPETKAPVTEPETEPSSETETGGKADNTETESNTETETQSGTETESGSDAESETQSDTETETESESETESETESEDHSQLNADWKTNIIASNASYLGQLSSMYGISFADDFGSLCSEAEAAFAQTLSDPENFHAANWKDVFAVFVYELKQRTGSASISSDSRALLMEIFTEMNKPVKSLDGPDISEVFTEEYPIEEALAAVDAQEELLLAGWNTGIGGLEVYMRAAIQEHASQQREALREERKAQMDRARYEKWLRLRQESELQSDGQTDGIYSTAELVPATIDDYVQRNGIDSAGRAEIESYASAQCLQLCAIASAAPQIVRASVGSDISEARVRIVTAAYSLVGKVGYFWGGKSFVFGWDDRWGSPAKVTADGSTSTGMTRSYGLDCSGFTLYCYYNGLGGSDAGIGGHTTSQWNASVMVDQINARPGDLVFYGGPERGDMNHVGLVVGKSADGGLIVAHCSSSQNGVVVGEAWSSGFRYVRTVPGLQ